jgi:signal transduction histidine kinase
MGIEVDLDLDVPEGALSEAGQLTAYRVVQEALTNVARHAGGTKATVSVVAEGPAVRVEIADDGRAAVPGWSAGYGLTGMRQRVESLGGRFVAGPDPAGGWRVRALLPRERT